MAGASATAPTFTGADRIRPSRAWPRCGPTRLGAGPPPHGLGSDLSWDDCSRDDCAKNDYFMGDCARGDCSRDDCSWHN